MSIERSGSRTGTIEGARAAQKARADDEFDRAELRGGASSDEGDSGVPDGACVLEVSVLGVDPCIAAMETSTVQRVRDSEVRCSEDGAGAGGAPEVRGYSEGNG